MHTLPLITYASMYLLSPSYPSAYTQVEPAQVHGRASSYLELVLIAPRLARLKQLLEKNLYKGLFYIDIHIFDCYGRICPTLCVYDFCVCLRRNKELTCLSVLFVTGPSTTNSSADSYTFSTLTYEPFDFFPSFSSKPPLKRGKVGSHFLTRENKKGVLL